MTPTTQLAFLISLTISQLLLTGVMATTFTLSNKCDYTVWPGILTNPGIASIPTTGFVLQQGENKTINAPKSWAGRFWARTLCSQDSSGKFTCVTGDCGSGKLECSGSGAVPPATLAEFTLNGANGLDFFDVSLVDGYNLPLLITPQGGSGSGSNCAKTGCTVDLNGLCPSELRVTSSEDGENGAIACKSACEAFQQPQYCCSGAYGAPDTCKPSSYSQIFKKACPTAYSYAYDDKTSTFTCSQADYLITFCPQPNTGKKVAPPVETTTVPTAPTVIGGTDGMVYQGLYPLDESSALSPTCRHVLGFNAISGVVSIGVVMWQLLQLV